MLATGNKKQFISNSNYSLNRDAKWLAWFEEIFTKIAGEDREISLEEFKSVLKVTKVRLSP